MTELDEYFEAVEIFREAKEGLGNEGLENRMNDHNVIRLDSADVELICEALEYDSDHENDTTGVVAGAVRVVYSRPDTATVDASIAAAGLENDERNGDYAV